ncbi:MULTISPECIES: glycoside hydrolase family 2 protein [unclassified Duganella]|uniref:beta-mannosidase n=1 Tax=unclassified Duganella TaxID=2636909 RepID=UPI000701CA59|nr:MULTISPECIES: glycoside hydrolase family 2 protein [unclassified Duganella]KQV51245.1 beta-mannosidase [Duganella sp. Root336D2]KRC02966.1 beta-mannosidase [Duganella sp. Root198D2]
MSTHLYWRSLAALLLGLCLTVVAAVASAATPVRTVIGDSWSFRLLPGNTQLAAHPEALPWHSAKVPGTVHSDLFARKLIPDPYVGAPEAGLQWIGLADWEYRTHFDALKQAARSDLVFEGLDTFAEVWLNGEKLFDADNTFRTWRIPVQGRLRAKGNELRVILRSPITRLLPAVRAMPRKLAGNYPSPFGDEPPDAMTGNFVRKPGYHYGWDWGPRYVTAGIWKPVVLESWDAARIDNLQLRQDHVNEARADIAAVVSVDAVRDGAFQLRLWQTAPGGKRSLAALRRVGLRAGGNRIELPLRIDRPQRWFPNGYGAQPLYRFEVEVSDGKAAIAKASARTGLRSIALRREPDDKGRSFYFEVNGIPVFAKGANSIPFDMFQPRVSKGQLRRVLQSARDANMNFLRSWGGGYYESEDFFDLADELGLMVWQDFMFGGGMPPAYDDTFRANVLAEARDNVRRLRNHPSLALWCGNNEEEIAWKYWGPGKEMMAADPAFASKVWNGYVQLFGTGLRKVVAEEGGGIAYWASSPSDDLAEVANTPASGDMHYWEVWGNPAHPPSKYLEITPRFMSEYGLQAWPVQRTIDAFASRGEQGIASPVIEAHQKFLAGKGNERLMKYVNYEFGEPKDFASFVYLGQAAQAEGIELAALHHRASRPYTMGTLYWQLNDVWPGASWSSVDWFGRWKALHFHARRFYAPVAVAALRSAEGRTSISLLNDRTHAVRGELRLRLMTLDGTPLREERKPVELAPLSATKLASYTDLELLGDADPASTVAVFDLQAEGEPASRRVVYFKAAKDMGWPDPGLKAELRRDGSGFTLELRAANLTRALWIDFGDADAEIADNAMTLLPGEPVALHIASKASLPALRKSLRLRSLAGEVRVY